MLVRARVRRGLLHVAQRHACIEGSGDERVTQRMRADRLGDARPAGDTPDDALMVMGYLPSRCDSGNQATGPQVDETATVGRGSPWPAPPVLTGNLCASGHQVPGKARERIPPSTLSAESGWGESRDEHYGAYESRLPWVTEGSVGPDSGIGESVVDRGEAVDDALL
jgi:hypothetical protein